MEQKDGSEVGMTNQEAAKMISNDMKLHHDYLSGQYRKALNMAIDALLKEQDPRILGWDEIKDYPVVYGEFRGVKDIYPLIITVDSWGKCLSWNPGINVSKEFILLVSDEEDRKNTRCWDKMPTEEQRQKVKWE